MSYYAPSHYSVVVADIPVPVAIIGNVSTLISGVLGRYRYSSEITRERSYTIVFDNLPILSWQPLALKASRVTVASAVQMCLHPRRLVGLSVYTFDNFRETDIRKYPI